MATAKVFLINGPTRRVRRRVKRHRRAVSLDKARKRKYRRINRSGRLPRRRLHKGVTVARRRRRRHHINGLRRTRRRLHHNPVHRRRRYRINARRHRRRYHRNPSIRGVTGAFMEGAKDGLAVWGGQIAARKISNMLGTLVPASIGQNSPALRTVITQGLGAVVTGIAVRRVLPRYSKLATAGAFANFIDTVVRLNPTANSFLSAYASPALPLVRGTRGYPLQLTPGVRGYLPSSGVGAMPLIGLPTTVGMA